MIISCPSCAARFRVPDDQVGTDGRTVRCGRCAYSWHQMPVAPEPAPLELQEQLPEVKRRPVATPAQPAASSYTPQPLAAPAAMREEDSYLSDEPEIPDSAPRFREGSLYPRARRPLAGLILGWALLLLVLGALGGGGWYFRNEIVAEVPELQKLYDWLGVPVEAGGQSGSLMIEDYAVLRTLEGDQRQLVVTGRLVNGSDQSQLLPRLVARVLDESGTELLTWQFDAAVTTLAPGETAVFESSHEHPDYGGQIDVEVTLASAG